MVCGFGDVVGGGHVRSSVQNPTGLSISVQGAPTNHFTDRSARWGGRVRVVAVGGGALFALLILLLASFVDMGTDRGGTVSVPTTM